jgi:hypothetical protein
VSLLVASLLFVWSVWLLARTLPLQNVALILGVMIGCEFALENIWKGGGMPLLFWPAVTVLGRVGWRRMLRHRRQEWNYGIWLALLASTTVALLQFVIALAGSPWAFAAKLAAIRFAMSGVCLFFLSPWFISKLPQQPHDHAQ